jgi:signal transduction histidine kinase/DNA-binding response OmpR family regulator
MKAPVYRTADQFLEVLRQHGDTMDDAMWVAVQNTLNAFIAEDKFEMYHSLNKKYEALNAISPSVLGTGVLLQKKAYYFEMAENYADAVVYSQKAIDHFTPTRFKNHLSESLARLCGLYRRLSNISEALKCAEQNLQLLQSNNDTLPTTIAQQYFEMAKLLHDMEGRMEDAFQFVNAGIKICKEYNIEEGTAFFMSYGGTLLNAQHQFDKSQKYLDQALDIAQKFDKRELIVSIIGTTGQNLLGKNKIKEALAIFQKGKDLAIEWETHQNKILFDIEIGKVYIRLKQFSDAEKVLSETFKSKTAKESKLIQRIVADELFKCYKGLKNYRDALYYLELSVQLLTESQNEKLNLQEKSIVAKFNVDQKVQEAQLLKDKNDALEEKNVLIQKEKEEANFQRKRAEASEQFKQLFLANMSHEIRTPMNAIVGMTNLLLDEPQPPKNLRYLNAIKHSSDNLLVVINDILDLSKIEAGKLKIEKTPFDIIAQLNQLQELFEQKVIDKKLKFDIKVSPDVPRNIMGDPHRIYQVLVNLLNNAIKFTHKGGVALHITLLPSNELCFTVKDTGIGIAKTKINSIFESFTQAETKTTRQYGGTGLGLAIAKQLVELMGGTIKVKSTLGKGSEFIFSLPLVETRKQTVQEKSKTTLSNLGKLLTSIRVLLAEDNEYNQIVAVESLKKFIPKLRIVTAKNGKQALLALQKEKFDVVLMDLHMPQMDGYTATQKIRSMKSDFATIPIIALTASVIRADIAKCMEAGMDGYIAKPFKMEELLEEMCKHILKSGKTTKTLQLQKSVKQLKPSSTALYNLDYLKDFTENNPTASNKYITLFQKSASRAITQIDISSKEQDSTALYKALHTLLPQTQFMGMDTTAEKIKDLQIALQNKKRSMPFPTEEINLIKRNIQLASKQLTLEIVK